MFLRLLALFIIVPAVELILLIKIGSKIGPLPTIALILVTGFLGAFLTKLQGALALANFRKAIFEGRIPKDEVLDGVMILVAGAVLLTPGFLTDAFGFLLLLPSFRKPVGKWIGRWVQKNVKVVSFDPRGPTGGPSGKATPDDGVIEAEAEIVDEKSP